MNWQNELIHAVTKPEELIELLNLDPDLIEPATRAAKLFPLRVPRQFIDRIEKGNARDPLLLQILPLHAELLDLEDYSDDPLQEQQVNPVPGLLHKYHGRVLLTISGKCAINCRYCFRRHFDYGANAPGLSGFSNIINYIDQDKTINEVILSGGDPLVMNDATLHQMLGYLANISHVQRLRIHSRIPVVLPSRITDEFLQAITHTRLKTIFVIHCNHPQEINKNVKDAIQALLGAKVVVLNQSVLLKGINDDVNILALLSEKLFETGVLPYYLHLLDKVSGSAHFDVNKNEAIRLHTELKNRLSGYLIPKLVCEQPGKLSKTAIFSGDFCTD